MATNPVPTAAFALLLLLGLDRSAGALDSYAFPARDGAALISLRNSVERTIVQVYQSQDGGKLIGTATIVDSEFGLAITAAHVAGDVGTIVWLAASGDGHRRKAGSSPGFCRATERQRVVSQPRDIAIRLGEPGAFGSYAKSVLPKRSITSPIN